ncbi:RICIN domain-containing protein [Shewanella gaetbuli]
MIKNKLTYIFFWLTLFVFSSHCMANSQDSTIQEDGLITTEHTFVSPIGELADPNIVYDNGWYYFIGTAYNSISMRRAKTLEELKTSPLKLVYTPQKGGPCCDFWAPEMHRINNTWYIYYTANTIGSIAGQRMWVLENTSDDPYNGEWLNRGRIYDPSNDIWAIDPTVFELRDELYMVYSAVADPRDGDKPQRLYINRMQSPLSLSPGRVLLSSPEFAFETDGYVNEGPAVLRRNGKTFLTYSGSGCWTPNYAIGMLWMNDSDDPMDLSSWTKLTEAQFSKNPGKGVYGTGHHSFFNSPDGTETWMAYHATARASGYCGVTERESSRTARAQKIEFDENGFPDFGVPEGTGVKIQAPSGEPALPTSQLLVNGIYKITPLNATYKSLDVENCSPYLGTNVRQWETNNSDCQKWIVQATDDGHFWIGAVAGGLALQLENCSTTNGSNVNMGISNGSICQKWDIIANDDGTYSIANVAANKLLDIQFGGNNNGANLQIYQANGNQQQRFFLDLLAPGPSIAAGSYEIISKKSSKAMDLANCNKDEGGNVQQFDLLNDDCQKWQVEPTEDGYYRIMAKTTGKALSVANCSVNLGANIQQSSANTDCEKFSIKHISAEWFAIISKINGLVVEVAGCSTRSGANIALWANWKGACQQWKFIPEQSRNVDVLVVE